MAATQEVTAVLQPIRGHKRRASMQRRWLQRYSHLSAAIQTLLDECSL